MKKMDFSIRLKVGYFVKVEKFSFLKLTGSKSGIGFSPATRYTSQDAEINSALTNVDD